MDIWGIPLKRAFSRGVVSFTPPRHRCGVHYGFSRWLMWLDGVFEVGHVISCHLPFLCKWRVHSVSLPRNSATLSSIPCQHDYYCTYCSVLKPETSCLTGAFGPAVIWRQGSKVLPNFGRELWEISHLFVWPSEVTAAKKRSFFGRPRERCPRYMSNGFIKSSSWKASDYENEDFVAGGVWVLWKDFMSMVLYIDWFLDWNQIFKHRNFDARRLQASVVFHRQNELQGFIVATCRWQWRVSGQTKMVSLYR